MSGSTVLGPVPSEWTVAPLAELASKIGSGATPRGGASVYVEHGVALIRSQNVLDHRFNSSGLAFIDDAAAEALRGVIVEQGDVLLNITGDSILRCTVVPDDVLPARVNQHVAIIRSKDRLHPLLLQKFLTHPTMKQWMLGLSSGGTRKAITKGHIESFVVPVPPPAEQRAMAEVLGMIDDKIESNRRRAEIAESLLDVLAVAVGDHPPVPLADLVEVDRTSCTPVTFGEALLDHFSIPAFDAGRLPDRTPGESIKSNKLVVATESVLVSRLNPSTNRTWYAVPDRGTLAAASTEFAVLRPGTGIGIGALWLAVRDEYFRSELARRATGTSGSHQRVRPADLVSIEVPDARTVPAEVAAEAEGLLKLVHQSRKESATLAELRDTLLPELLSGRLRVPFAEELMEAAT